MEAIFRFSTASGSPLGPNQPHIQGIWRHVSPTINQPRHNTDPSTPHRQFIPKVKKNWTPQRRQTPQWPTAPILYIPAVSNIPFSTTAAIIKTRRVNLVKHVARVGAAQCIDIFGRNIRKKHLGNFIGR